MWLIIWICTVYLLGKGGGFKKSTEYNAIRIAIRKNVLQYVLETKILQYIGKPIILHSPKGYVEDMADTNVQWMEAGVTDVNSTKVYRIISKIRSHLPQCMQTVEGYVDDMADTNVQWMDEGVRDISSTKVIMIMVDSMLTQVLCPDDETWHTMTVLSCLTCTN